MLPAEELAGGVGGSGGKVGGLHFRVTDAGDTVWAFAALPVLAKEKVASIVPNGLASLPPPPLLLEGASRLPTPPKLDASVPLPVVVAVTSTEGFAEIESGAVPAASAPTATEKRWRCPLSGTEDAGVDNGGGGGGGEGTATL